MFLASLFGSLGRLRFRPGSGLDRVLAHAIDVPTLSAGPDFRLTHYPLPYRRSISGGGVACGPPKGEQSMQRQGRNARRPRSRFRPSTWINSIEEIRPGSFVLLWCRVSSGLQCATGNNADKEAELRAATMARGGVAIEVVAHAGRIADGALCRVAALAARHGAVLLAESTSRFIRWVCGDVPLVTLLDPDATWRDERAHQSKRGQRRKGKPGGGPTKSWPGYKRVFRLRLMPKVRWMKYAWMRDRAIARALVTDKRNVGRWGGALFAVRTSERWCFHPRNIGADARGTVR